MVVDNSWLFCVCFFVINTFNNVESPRIIEATIVGVIYMSYNGEICLYDKWEIVITLKALIVSVLLMSVISLNKIKSKNLFFYSSRNDMGLWRNLAFRLSRIH